MKKMFKVLKWIVFANIASTLSNVLYNIGVKFELFSDNQFDYMVLMFGLVQLMCYVFAILETISAIKSVESAQHENA